MFCSLCDYIQGKVSKELSVPSPRTTARTSPAGYGYLAQRSPLRSHRGISALRERMLGSPTPETTTAPLPTLLEMAGGFSPSADFHRDTFVRQRCLSPAQIPLRGGRLPPVSSCGSHPHQDRSEPLKTHLWPSVSPRSAPRFIQLHGYGRLSSASIHVTGWADPHVRTSRNPSSPCLRIWD